MKCTAEQQLITYYCLGRARMWPPVLGGQNRKISQLGSFTGYL